MRDLFFYGTLCHRPLLDLVLGHDGAKVRAAQLPDHAVYWAKDQVFPIIEATPGEAAIGLLVQGLSDQDIARLEFYEGGFDYDLAPLSVTAEGQSYPAGVFIPAAGRWPRGAVWSLGDWADQWGALSLLAAEEVMSYFGQRSAREVDTMFPMIRTRAASTLRAQAGGRAKTFSDRPRSDVHIQDRRRVYSNFFALDEFDLSHKRFDGGESPVVERAVFIAADVALVLPYDPKRDRVLLVEQMRMGPLARGDQLVWQLEPIAGRVDPYETPAQAAIREAQEEAALTLTHLEEVAQVYASPGTSTEFYNIFCALADLPDAGRHGHGLDSEDEDIRTHILTFDAFMELIDSFGANNAPLVLLGHWLARHRNRLRALQS